MSTCEKIRLFIAIPVPTDPAITEIINRLKLNLPYCRINWVPSENLHLTLKFIGDTEREYVTPLITKLGEISKFCKSFRLRWAEPGYFGQTYKPSVIWYGVEEHGDLQNLQTSVENVVTGLCLAATGQKFKAHLTLARVKSSPAKINMEPILSGIGQIQGYLPVTSFRLYQSVPGKSAPAYICLNKFFLKSPSRKNDSADK
jgi:2'-5' RNA ligase